MRLCCVGLRVVLPRSFGKILMSKFQKFWQNSGVKISEEDIDMVKIPFKLANYR